MDANLNFTTTTILASLAGFFLVIGAIILVLRAYLNKAAESNLMEIHKNESTKPSFESRNKYTEVDAFQFRGLLLNVGLILMLGLTTVLFNWTTYEKEVAVMDFDIEIDEEIVVEPPRTKEPPPPPPPPPPPVIQEVAADLVLDDEDIEFVDQSLEAETEVIAPVVPVKREEKITAPPPPPPPEPEVEEIFKVVEDMPRFPGCEDMAGTKDEKKRCADKRLYEYIYKYLTYPNIARENNIAGTVVIQFVVEKDGSIGGAKVVRDIGGGCGKSALDIVNQMNTMPTKWIPGKQRGRPVRVIFNLPVRFKLINT
ncbi:MAG: energy transducer TonB [Bacteroidetes bacterium]|jgi:protein TonB|nr:energy transducer TonB [Bacteroidota bacterium]MDF1867899.1 energy transducer TonB [Saprospiraceae bacterium]